MKTKQVRISKYVFLDYFQKIHQHGLKIMLSGVLIFFSLQISAQSYRYYRFTPTSGNSLELADIRWMNGTSENPATNLTNGSTVTASNSGWWSAFDNNRTVGAWLGSPSGSQFITVDLGSLVAINAVKVQISGWSTLNGFVCAGSSDNSTFTTIYTATAINQTGNTAVTYSIGGAPADTQSPTVPTGLASASVTQTSFTLNWSASSDNTGVTGYEVFRNGTSIGTPTSTTLAITGLAAGTTYNMTVRARDAAGNWSAISSTLNVSTSAAGDTQAPTVPTGLASSSVAQTSFTLNWAASTDNLGVTGYEVFRNGTSIGTPNATTFNVTGLTASTAYSLTVRARDAAGNNSSVSTPLSVTTSAATGTQGLNYQYYEGTFSVLPNFGGLATIKTGTVANFDLTPRNRNDLFAFRYTGNINIATAGTYTFFTSSDDGSKLFINGTEVVNNDGLHGMQEASGNISLAAGSQTIMVTFFENAGGEGLEVRYSGPSITKQLIPNSVLDRSAPTGDTQAPSAPASLSSANISPTSFTLNWSASSDNVGVTGYEIFRGGTSIGTPTATTFNVTGLTANTAYSLTVRARDAAGNWSTQSSALSVTTSAASDTQAPSVPASLSSANISPTSFTLNWSASSDNVGVTGYEVFRGGTSIGTPTATTFNITGLTASTAYGLTVRARDAAGNWSAQSSALSVTTSATSDTQAPTIPSGLNVTGISSTSFTLNWNASTDNVGVTAYEVFRDGTSQGTTANSNLVINGLTASTIYALAVRARDAAGNWSSSSTSLSVTTAANQQNPVHVMETQDIMNLVPLSGATNTAVASGPWTNTQTWASGAVPGNNARVVIPSGITVDINSQLTSRISTVRIDGILRFSHTINTQLLVETMVVSGNGLLEIGTSSQPVPANVTARVRFLDNGDLNFSADPKLLSRGLLALGQVRIYGQTKTQFLKTTQYLPAGTTQITLQSTPSGWQVGDRIVVSGMRYRNHNDGAETFTIAAISGAQITLSAPIQRTKTIQDTDPVFAGLFPYVANLSRNIIMESEVSTPVSRRGHVMLMHSTSYEVQNVLFRELGRTNKSISFTKTPTSATSNMFGRYPIHFHRTGDMDRNSTPIVVKGCAVDGSPGWGFVSHESHVNFEDNVSYNVFGSHFVGENGTEIGGFYRNIAIFSQGSGDGTQEKNRSEGDHGHTGIGFWLTSGSLKVVDNVATDHNNAGYAIITRKTPVEAHDFYAQNWDNPAVFGGLDRIEVERLGLNTFKGNIAYACRGMHIIDMELNGMMNTENLIEDFISLNAEGDKGLDLEYSRNLRFKNVKVLRDGSLYTDDNNGTYGIKVHNTWDHRFPFAVKSWNYFENVHIHGFQRGINNEAGLGENDSKVYIINNSLVTNLKSSTIVRDTRPEKLRYVSSSDLLVRPVYSVTPGFYGGPRNVTLSMPVSGTTIYYKVLRTNDEWRIYDCCELATSLFGQLTPGDIYSGQQISTAGFRWTVIVAYATKNNVISPISIAFYKNDPNLPGGRIESETIETENSLTIYPNPAQNSYATISTGMKSGSLLFIDAVGQIKLRTVIVAASQDVDIRTLANGVYTVIALSAEGERKSSQLVIQH